MDWSEKHLCIKCDQGGNLLVCSENGCPLAIHEGCMGFPARFNDAGHFYCPYCLYKQAVAESRQAREYALARKKALLAFMDEDVVGREKPSESNKGAEANGNNYSKDSEPNVNVTACGGDKISGNSDSIREQSIHLGEEDEIRGEEDGKSQEEDIEASAGPKDQEPSVQMPGEQNICNGKEIEAFAGPKDQEPSVQMPGEQNICTGKEIEDEEHEVSAASSSQEKGLRNAEEEKNVEEECETSYGYSDQDSLPFKERAKRALKSRKSIGPYSETVSVKSKPDEQNDKNRQTSPNMNTPRRSSRRASSASRAKEAINKTIEVSKGLKQPGKVDVSKRLKKPELPIMKLGKRKRLVWSEEEEEMLKAGVDKHLKGPSKNIPWKEILEMGRNVFDRTRTPCDLKYKWKNMSRHMN
ncbi:RING/FYVE/PHD zinc finger superfamily protein [Striga asiatica]|uniref:RING/FYVE/PHD zinc finger superfamily protein n=1 Tax=Striga asiatica TaxID=4170 RepID=A0A5A7R6R5_STRAF|nr:RING/FYVE/PHD zinc finger superfamily protein [Striga asiatica]